MREERKGRWKGLLYCINNRIFVGSSDTFEKSSDERRGDDKNAKTRSTQSGQRKNNKQLLVEGVVCRLPPSFPLSLCLSFLIVFLFIGTVEHMAA